MYEACRFCDSSLAYAFFGHGDDEDLALDCLHGGDVLVAHRLDGETRDDLHEHPEIVGGVGFCIITAASGGGGRA